MKFSIVMPMYKQSEELILRSINSILSQTYNDFELIIFNNGNDENNIINAINFIKELELRDERIIYFKKEKNVGWPKGISLCLEKATGDYMGFIAADDYLEKYAFEKVSDEIRKNNPDVVWMGNKHDIIENGNFKTVETVLPPYIVLDGKKQICENLMQFFQSVYYNAMHHYVRMDLLKKHSINFYDKYYSDCGGMTKILSVSDKMVILNEAPYHLTIDTSLTRGKYQIGFYTMFASQWTSMMELLTSQKKCDENLLKYLAQRFERNHLGNLDILCNDAECRNDVYENVSVSYNNRFKEIEKTLCDEAIAEMIYFYGREEYFYTTLNHIINLLQNAKLNGQSVEEVISDSEYLGLFISSIVKCVDERVEITNEFNRISARNMLISLQHENNLSMYGYEIFMKIGEKVFSLTQDVFSMLKVKDKYRLKESNLISKYFDVNKEEILNKKLISIVWTHFHRKECVEEFINYIISEKFEMEQIEIIFINNLINNDLYMYLLEIEKQYPNSIGIINLEEAVEENEAINIGISYVSTDFIKIIRGDNWNTLTNVM